MATFRIKCYDILQHGITTGTSSNVPPKFANNNLQIVAFRHYNHAPRFRRCVRGICDFKRGRVTSENLKQTIAALNRVRSRCNVIKDRDVKLNTCTTPCESYAMFHLRKWFRLFHHFTACVDLSPLNRWDRLDKLYWVDERQTRTEKNLKNFPLDHPRFDDSREFVRRCSAEDRRIRFSIGKNRRALRGSDPRATSVSPLAVDVQPRRARMKRTTERGATRTIARVRSLANYRPSNAIAYHVSFFFFLSLNEFSQRRHPRRNRFPRASSARDEKHTEGEGSCRRARKNDSGRLCEDFANTRQRVDLLSSMYLI